MPSCLHLPPSVLTCVRLAYRYSRCALHPWHAKQRSGALHPHVEIHPTSTVHCCHAMLTVSHDQVPCTRNITSVLIWFRTTHTGTPGPGLTAPLHGPTEHPCACAYNCTPVRDVHDLPRKTQRDQGCQATNGVVRCYNCARHAHQSSALQCFVQRHTEQQLDCRSRSCVRMP